LHRRWALADSIALTQIGGSIVAIQYGLNARLVSVVLTEMPAAAEVAAAKAAHVPAAKATAEAARVADVSAGEMTAAELAAEPAHVAHVSAGEMTAAELAAEPAHVADVSAHEVTAAELAAEASNVAEVCAGEMSPVPVESEAPVEAVAKTVVETDASDEDRTTIPVTRIVIWIGVAVTIVVARPIIRPIGSIAAVRIAGRGAGDRSGRHGRAGIITIAVNVAMSVSPNVVAVACVAMRDIPVQALPGQAMPVPAV
jgi:hypothetical protein